MSTERNDGGQAFPVNELNHVTGDICAQHLGMSLRDYFAIHSTQPGMAEIVKAAGLGMDRNRRVYLTADDQTGTHFDDWWQTLTLERQCELSAAVRFAQADAMLKVRKA